MICLLPALCPKLTLRPVELSGAEVHLGLANLRMWVEEGLCTAATAAGESDSNTKVRNTVNDSLACRVPVQCAGASAASTSKNLCADGLEI
jgi:hypothetical protein